MTRPMIHPQAKNLPGLSHAPRVSFANRSIHGVRTGHHQLIRVRDQLISTPELAHDGALTFVHHLHAVAHGRLDVANVLNEALETAWLYRGGLIGAPHGSIERDVSLDQAGAKAHRCQRCREPNLVPGVPDGTIETATYRLNHPEIEFRERTWIGARRMRNEEVVGA